MRICICISVLACCLSSARSQDLVARSRTRFGGSFGRALRRIGIEGKNVGTMSDAEGNFVLPVADAAGNADTLLFSCVGYAPRENSRIGDRFFSGILLRFEAERQPDSETVVRTSRSRRMKIGRSKIGTDLLSARDPSVSALRSLSAKSAACCSAVGTTAR